MIGNPMAHPMAADSVKDATRFTSWLYNLNRFGSPLPIHGLGTPGRTSNGTHIQDQNFMAYQTACKLQIVIQWVCPEFPFLIDFLMEDNRKEALNKATKAKQKMADRS